jgi:hypothetical protein
MTGTGRTLPFLNPLFNITPCALKSEVRLNNMQHFSFSLRKKKKQRISIERMNNECCKKMALLIVRIVQST